MKTISATQFKARCLQLMDEVQSSGEPVVITKHRRAVARLVAEPRRRKSLMGDLKGIITLHEEGFDWMAPVTPPEDWEHD